MSFLKIMINSIARTFGRILAYALIGLAIYFIGSKFAFAAPQYRVSTGSWGEWTNANVDTEYTFATNLNSSWSSYIQLKDTVAFDNNKTYNLNANLEIQLQETGTKDMNSALDPYIYNGSTLTNQTDKCTVTGTRSDKTSTISGLTYTTHTFKVNVNCVGLKEQGYYPYITLRFLTNGSSVPTAIKFNVKSWEYHVGSDSTDANNIMNNANQNTQQIIENYNQNTQEIIQNNIDLANNLVETIENQNKVCNDDIIYNSNKDNALVDGKFLNNDGTEIIYNDTFISDYYRADGNFTTLININGTSAPYTPSYCFYTEDKTKISCESFLSRREVTVTNPSNAYYIRVSGYYSNTILVKTTYCYDYREKETEQNEEVIDNLKSMLTIFSDDSSVSDSSINTALNGIQLADDTPMTNILMFPVLIFSYFNSNMSNTCSPVNLGTLYGHQITLPCIDIQSLIGSTLYNIIDLFMLFYMLYNFCHFLIGFFESSSELNNPFEHFFVKGADTNG